jgi:hypothetical protein
MNDDVDNYNLNADHGDDTPLRFRNITDILGTARLRHVH